jgi:hypothetical protein
MGVMTQVIRPFSARHRRAAAGVVCTVLLGGMTACTGGSSESSSPSPSPSASTGGSATLTARPVPLKVLVTRVSGTLKKADRATLQRNIGPVIETYFDNAFLGGDYPRSDFGNAFASFSGGAARKASADRDLLTNRTLGASTESVTPKQQAAYLSVLAPNKVAAGVTARIQLRFVANRGDRPARQVTLTGRLLLTRKKGGGWQIFGYDVARSVGAPGKATTAKGTSR